MFKDLRWSNWLGTARPLGLLACGRRRPPGVINARAYEEGEARKSTEIARLTIASERICLSEIAPYISFSVLEPGFDGLARTNLRFSEQGGP